MKKNKPRKKQAGNEYFSSITHKINNILSSSNISIELLLRGIAGELRHEQKKYLKSVLSDGKKIKALIKKLNDSNQKRS